MTRMGITAISVALTSVFWAPVAATHAQTAPAATQMAQATPPAAEEAVPRRSNRPTRRIHIYPRNDGEYDGVYPRYNPGPNAVRDCTATYVEEHRPSGTVITPRMNCFWRPG